MGKVTWGGGLTADNIDGAERSQFKPYDGPVPPEGVYAFRIKVLRKAKSQAGNPKLFVGLELVPRRTRPDDKQYEGFFVGDGIPIMDEDWAYKRLASFTDAIGVRGADFISRTVDDGTEEKNILKIGKVAPVGMFVLALIEDDEYQGKLRKKVGFTGYYPAPNAADSADEPDGDADDNTDDAPPF